MNNKNRQSILFFGKRKTPFGALHRDFWRYAFRCFLLKLGFIGDRYKAARKIVLARLEGDSAWKEKP